MNIAWNLRAPGPGARLFAMTLLSTLIPAAVLAVLTVDRIGQIMTQKAYVEVDRRARVFATSTSDRLMAAEDRLRLIAAQLGNEALDTHLIGEIARPYFSAVAYVDHTGHRTDISGVNQSHLNVDSAETAQLLSGESLVIATRDENREVKIILLRKPGSITRATGVLMAEIDLARLWGGHGTNTESSGVCVLDKGYAPLSCPRQPPDTVLSHLKSEGAEPSDEMLEWDDGTNKWLGSYAKLRLQPRLRSADWTVLASQRHSTALETIAAFGSVFGVFLVLSVLFAGAIVWTQIRRSPAGAASLSIRTADNAASAETSSVTERFERQSHAMTALSDIDRAILSHASFDRVTESVLKNAPQVIGADFVAIVLIDRDAPTRSQTIMNQSGQPQKRTVERGSIDVATTRLLASRPDGCWINEPGDYSFLQPLVNRGAKRFILFPVFFDGRVSAILALAFDVREALNSDERTYARDFADRLGVALTASALNEELRLQGQFDSTTALPNRRAFKDRMSQELARARREMRQIALLFIDLDEFKKVNDSVGHSGGDALLEQASRRLKHCLREEDIVARFGGDEFAILLPAVAKGADAAVVAEKLINQLSRPYNLAGQDQYLSASIGICIYPDDAQTVDTMLRNADMAMYRAKAEGGGQYAFFEERMNAQVLDRAALEVDLRNALANDELMLFFQPLVDLHNRRIVGAEALVRWSHSSRGIVLPGTFISVAEQSGLIEEIGQYVREAACMQYCAWEPLGIAPPRISVNISSREIRRSDFIARIEAVLRESGVRPYCLEFEITESLFVDNTEHIVAALKWLRDRGIRIAIDDFGTGYSSIAYLKRLPFDTLKLDRTFVKDIGNADGSDAIIAAILGMAKSLGKEVVAEGVETVEQRDFLIHHGCDCAQGYLWSKPMPPHEFEVFARDWQSVPEQARPIDSSNTVLQ